jgi:glycosyltransferase involved in cell wall biosynthesis
VTPTPQSSGERIAAHRARFDELLTAVDARQSAGELNSAAVLAQVAAALGWHSPTGLFASPRLEFALTELGRTIVTGVGRAQASRTLGNHRHRILHVLTTAYLVGGHTRLAWRWIERDNSRVHSVALTRQGFQRIPEALRAAVRSSGGDLVRIDRAADDIAGRARGLAAAASVADVVVLHTHPFDVVPTLALAGLDANGARPPTMLLNHADHLFWVGIAVSDLVVHLRNSGAQLSVARRGLPPDRSTILPLPLGRARTVADRGGARRRLGYHDQDVLAVSIASGYKFGVDGSPGLLTLMRQAVDREPALHVLAVGPGGRRDWGSAEAATGGRIRGLGNQPDLTDVYGAADIYVDSYPFSSLTSMLEAGQHGIPLLALTDGSGDTDVLAFDDPATDRLPITARSPSAFLDALGQLVEDRAIRRELGRRIGDDLASVHEGAGWRARLEAAYARVHELHTTPRRQTPVPDAEPSSQPSELDQRLVALLDAQQADAPRGVRGHLRLAPFDLRLEEWRRSRRSDRPLSPLVLLPNPVLMLARQAAILTRSLRASLARLRRPTTGAR